MKRGAIQFLLAAGSVGIFLLALNGIFSMLPGRNPGGTPPLTRTLAPELPATPAVSVTLEPSPALTASPTRPVADQASGRLAFVSTRGRYPALYIINADGSGLAPLTDEMGFISPPVWSLDGKRLAFSGIQDYNEETGDAEIYVVNADGSGLADLSNSPAAETSPDWSPDGKQIVFSSTRTGKEELYVVGVDGAGLRQLTGDPKTFARDPRWSPDGSRIAFTCTQGFDSSICLIHLDGTGLVTLAPGVSPLWSPDGKRIAFHGPGDGGHTAIFVIDADGKGSEQLTRSDADAFSFAWSPDGRWIAFHSNLGNNIELYKVCTACGKNARATRLTDDPDQMPNDPLWSPDGRMIAYFVDGSLFLMNADGTGKSRLVDGVLPKSYAWQP